MKKCFTILCVLFAVQSLSAQTFGSCVPDSTIVDSMFFIQPRPFQEEDPGSGIQEQACIGQPYQIVITFRIDSTFMFSGATLAVDSLVLNDVSGLPEGFQYACSTDNCVFPKNSLGCAVIYGTATADNPVGEYSLEVSGTVNTGGVPIPASFPSTLFPGEYIITLLPEDSENCFVFSNTSDYLEERLFVENYPNPFTGRTTIRVKSNLNDRFQFSVLDVLGREIHRESVRILEGENQIEYDGSHLNAGLYYYTLRNEQGVLSRRMIVE